MTFDEKIEIIYDAYTRTLDYDIACLRADLSEEEIEKVNAHEGLQIRIKLYDADQREELIANMRALSRSHNETIKLNATVKLGRMIYSKRFDKTKEDGDGKVRPSIINLVGVKPDDADG